MAKVMTTSRLSRFQACYTVGLRVRLVTDQQTEEDCRAYMSKIIYFKRHCSDGQNAHTHRTNFSTWTTEVVLKGNRRQPARITGVVIIIGLTFSICSCYIMSLV